MTFQKQVIKEMEAKGYTVLKTITKKTNRRTKTIKI